MKKHRILILTALILSTALLAAGCADTDGGSFSYSDGLADDGYWKDVTAADRVTLPVYEEVPIPDSVREVAEEDIEAELDRILQSNFVPEQITDRAVSDGDTVHIDYEGRVGGELFEGGSTGGAGTDVTIGQTPFIEGFLEQLIGREPGETFDIDVTFPDDYGSEELKGKDAMFTIELHYIVDDTAPELTDAFVREILSEPYGWQTVADVEASVTADLEQVALLTWMEEYLMDAAVVDEVPEVLVRHHEQALIDYYEEYATYYETDLDTFLSEQMDLEGVDQLLEQNSQQNLEAATYYLVMQAIAEDIGLAVTEADVAAYFEDNLGITEYSEFSDEYGLPYLHMVALHQAVLNHCLDHAA